MSEILEIYSDFKDGTLDQNHFEAYLLNLVVSFVKRECYGKNFTPRKSLWQKLKGWMG